MLPPHNYQIGMQLVVLLYSRSISTCSCGLPATDDYVTDQRLGISYSPLPVSLVSIIRHRNTLIILDLGSAKMPSYKKAEKKRNPMQSKTEKFHDFSFNSCLTRRPWSCWSSEWSRLEVANRDADIVYNTGFYTYTIHSSISHNTPHRNNHSSTIH